MRKEQHRFIQYTDGSEELYDHNNDLYEWTNIASRPESLAVIKHWGYRVREDLAFMKHINRFIRWAAFGCIAAPLCPVEVCAAEGAVARPNIVVVMADDHAFEAISAYRTYLKQFAKTPAIDRLGEEGVRFDNFVCGNSICSPSRASILTGQYSHKNGVRGLGGSINETSPQYPVELQNAGYQTWLVGKWHLGSKPKGYQKYMVVKGQGKYFDPTFNGTEGTWKRKGYSTDVYTDIAMDWLSNRDRENPFLMCLQFKAPHHEYGHAERYTYLHLENHPAELFDRQADPDQRHNVASDPANKGLINMLEEELQRQIEEVDIPTEDLPGFTGRGSRSEK